MPEFHKYMGFVVVAVFAVGWIWGLGAWILRRWPGDKFWWWLAVAQVLAGFQAIVGVILLLLGYRPLSLLHYVYGFGPFLVLAGAHLYARKPEQGRPWIPFALAAFICFGLTLRALMTGLGMG